MPKVGAWFTRCCYSATLAFAEPMLEEAYAAKRFESLLSMFRRWMGGLLAFSWIFYCLRGLSLQQLVFQVAASLFYAMWWCPKSCLLKVFRPSGMDFLAALYAFPGWLFINNLSGSGEHDPFQISSISLQLTIFHIAMPVSFGSRIMVDVASACLLPIYWWAAAVNIDDHEWADYRVLLALIVCASVGSWQVERKDREAFLAFSQEHHRRTDAELSLNETATALRESQSLAAAMERVASFLCDEMIMLSAELRTGSEYHMSSALGKDVADKYFPDLLAADDRERFLTWVHAAKRGVPQCGKLRMTCALGQLRVNVLLVFLGGDAGRYLVGIRLEHVEQDSTKQATPELQRLSEPGESFTGSTDARKPQQATELAGARAPAQASTTLELTRSLESARSFRARSSTSSLGSRSSRSARASARSNGEGGRARALVNAMSGDLEILSATEDFMDFCDPTELDGLEAHFGDDGRGFVSWLQNRVQKAISQDVVLSRQKYGSVVLRSKKDGATYSVTVTVSIPDPLLVDQLDGFPVSVSLEAPELRFQHPQPGILQEVPEDEASNPGP